MSNNDENSGCGYLIICAFFVAFSLVWWVVASSIEASSFNRATNSNVSTWDAMFLELRVQGEPEK